MIRIILEAGMLGRFPDSMRRSEKFRTGERVNITRFPADWNLALAHIVTSHDPTNSTFRGQLATAARGQTPLVRLDSEGLSIDCEAVGAERADWHSTRVVRPRRLSAIPRISSTVRRPFWRLLQGYTSRLVARHAVTHIIATSGL
jgi:hypothetical protein